MDKQTIKELYETFKKDYDQTYFNNIWIRQSNEFREFWNNRVMNDDGEELYDQEIDDIVRILDVHGKGNTKSSEAIARVMIPQGAWRRLFNQLKEDSQLSSQIDKILKSNSLDNRAKEIDKLYELNRNNKNNLTGESGNAINCLLAAYDPFENISVVSLNHRKKLLNEFGEESESLFSLPMGKRITETGRLIKEIFIEIEEKWNARTISKFLYSDIFDKYWKYKNDNTLVIDEDIDLDVEEENKDDYIFYIEKHLEDFLIENWDKTELGKKHELINDENGLVSQQYRTDIGTIDILVKEKNTGRYVVIELKRNQTSDTTIGQIARYMGWVEENLSKGTPAKGIIIAGKYDTRLKYAMRMIRDIEVYLYQVDFNLKEFS